MARGSRSAPRRCSLQCFLPEFLGLIICLALVLLVYLGQQINGHTGVSLEQHAFVTNAPETAPVQLADIPTYSAFDVRVDQKPSVADDNAFLKPNTLGTVTWIKHAGKSCQSYVNGDVIERSLEEAKVACEANDACVAIECPHEHLNMCTLRASPDPIDYAPADCYEKVEKEQDGSTLSTKLHPAISSLIEEYSFKPMLNQYGRRVNIVLVQAPLGSDRQRELYHKYKNELLFLGISSLEDYPLPSGNPFSEQFPPDTYVGLFPGFLHMMHEPQKFFPPHVKTILMSQSDFELPNYPARDYSVPRKYDFTLSGSDQDVANDCVGWSSYAKNWSFVKESLKVMCGEYKLRGVLVATKDKQGEKACTIPDSCEGLMIQTSFLTQEQYFHYLSQSRFAYLPQVHDASPRVSTQALSLDVPLLMNAHISGGWKYVNEKTGEFFHDMSDFRQSLQKILTNADIPYRYEPRKYVMENYGNPNSGPRLLKFVEENFGHRVKLPQGTTQLVPSSR